MHEKNPMEISEEQLSDSIYPDEERGVHYSAYMNLTPEVGI